MNPGKRGAGGMGGAAVGALLLALSACPECDPVGLVGEEHHDPAAVACTVKGQTCGTGESFRDGQCRQAACTADADCCPSTRCDLMFGMCRSRLLDIECVTDADCPHYGQRCVEDTGLTECIYDACKTDADCRVRSVDLSCFQGRCVGENPCRGGCPAGEVCDVATASCHPAVGRLGCEVPCQEGSLRVLTNPEEMSGAACCGWECQCVPLPPLKPGVVGSYAAVAVAHLEVAVASYDLTYGDLVVSHFDKRGALQQQESVDGFPPNGTVEGALDGPRHGVVEPGPDVGRWVSAGVDALGRVQLAYHDATAGALKYAVGDVPGQWSIHVVDDAGVAGQFTSLTFRPTDGVPVISYLVTGITDAQGRAATAVKVAVGKHAQPMSAADWDVVQVEQAPVADACDHTCSSQSTCVLRPAGDAGPSAPACLTASTACASACSSGQACVQWYSQPTCLPLGNPPVEGLPRVLGLFTSVAARGPEVLVAYYDNVHGLLKGAVITSAGPGGPVVVDGDGQGGHVLGDVGAHVSLAVDQAGKLALAYEDFTHRELRFFHGVSFSSGAFHVVDSGRGHPPGVDMVGAGASLAFSADGTAYVAYQEQTLLDLRLAQLEPDGTWTVQSPLRDGPFGFFADLGLSSESAYVASVKPALDSRRSVANQLGLTVLPIPLQ